MEGLNREGDRGQRTQTSCRLVVLAEGLDVVDEDVPDLVSSVHNRAICCWAQLCDLPFRLRTERWVVFGTVTRAHWKGNPYIYTWLGSAV